MMVIGEKRVAELLPIVSGIYGSRASSYAYTDEDRRLFYVAMTRAKKEVYISYARLDAEDARDFRRIYC
jgi:superfamily I DNA/RNA helicase